VCTDWCTIGTECESLTGCVESVKDCPPPYAESGEAKIITFNNYKNRFDFVLLCCDKSNCGENCIFIAEPKFYVE